MAEKIKLVRVFKHGNIELGDPGEEMDKDEVLNFYSNQYPELINSKVSGPTIENDKMVYEFTTSVGTKG